MLSNLNCLRQLEADFCTSLKENSAVEKLVKKELVEIYKCKLSYF